MCQVTTRARAKKAADGPVPLSTAAEAAVEMKEKHAAAAAAAKAKASKKSIMDVHSIERSGWVDLAAFLAPLLASSITDVRPIYITGIARIVSIRVFMTLHYLFFDKDNYNMKLRQSQLKREKDDYLVGPLLHMWAQVVLQLIFPSMFFASDDQFSSCAYNTFLSHVAIVEPLYYFAHRWLHIPNIFKMMHSFHHTSIKTLPSTSLVQDFKEHFIYIAVFGPAFLVPFILTGQNHWAVISAYLVLFDLVNAFGHTNIPLRSWIFNSKWSPIRYAFYTPEFHLGHHKYYKANYGLFMPIWDHMLGTYREYKIPTPEEAGLLPAEQQDIVFIGHNGGLGHILTCPEFSVYNVYDEYIRSWLPLPVEFLLMDFVGLLSRLVMKSYKVSRYVVDEKYVGRIICVLRTPMDYIKESRHAKVNADIVKLIEREHKERGTRYFGLGNLNKMKQLNEGGTEIARLVEENEYLKDKNIRIWTGDTMTSASVFDQIVNIPDIKEVFYIGASGKIGKAVVHLLAERGIKVCIYSRYHATVHPNVSYTTDLHDMAHYKHVVIGKLLNPKVYAKAVRTIKENQTESKTRYLLDYTVPFIPLDLGKNISHIQIGVLSVGAKPDGSAPVLRGHFDVCMGHDENQIYPCHTGCIVNMLEKKETNETGDIDVSEVTRLWKVATSLGLRNREPLVPIH